MGRPGPPSDLCTVTWKWFPEQPSLRGLHGGSLSHFSCELRKKGAFDTKLGGGALGEEMQL